MLQTALVPHLCHMLNVAPTHCHPHGVDDLLQYVPDIMHAQPHCVNEGSQSCSACAR
jgi:hypothetical protein